MPDSRDGREPHDERPQPREIPIADSAVDRLEPLSNRHRAPRVVAFGILAIFFTSGACGLIYETVWQKMLCLVFGITTYATTTILVAFMGGLAAGSYVFGKSADRTRRPLRIYACLEAGVGLFALAFPLIVAMLTTLFAGFAARFAPSPQTIAVVRFVLCAAVLAVPAVLMGGTLPVMSKYYVRNIRLVGAGTGMLYGLNTLGGVVGCFMAGFVLMVAYGTRATLYGAAAANLALAALAFLIDRRYPALAAPEAPAETEADPVPPSVPAKEAGRFGALGESMLRLLLVAAFVSGFCALAYEVLWTRTLPFFLQSSVYSFPTMLTSFLCGSALGSLLYAKVFDRTRNPILLLGVLQLLVGITAVLTLFEFTYLSVITRGISQWLGREWQSFVGTGFAASFTVMLLPSLLMGIAFPAMTRAFTRSMTRLGRSIGSLYSVNTVGCVLGSVAAGFIVVPMVGVVKGITIIAAVNAILGVVFLTAAPSRPRWRWLAVAVGAGMIAFGVYLAATWRVPLAYYGPKFYRLFNDGDVVIYYREVVDGTITVTEMAHHPFDGVRYRDIEVDGVSVAGDSPVLRTTQKVQGHVPLLLFKATTGRDARKAFILGLGTGEASSCIARHDVERVDCGELVAAEVGANHLFRHINNDILTQPKFNLIINDARNHLLTTSTTYDVIQSDSVHPMVAFNTYTKEYYELCRRRLSDRGIFSTWIPLFAFTEDNMRTLIRTLASVFPHVSVWWAPNYENKHAILIGTNHPLDIDYPTLKEEFSKPTIRASLDEVDLGDMTRLLGTFVADETTLGDYARGAELNTDDNLHLSYQIPRNPRKGDETVPENLEAFARLGRSIVPYVRNLSPDERSRIGIDRHYAARTHVLSAMASYYRAKEGGEEGGFAEASREYELALQATPDDPVLRRLLAEMKFFGGRARAEALSRTGKYAAAVAEYSSLIEIVPNNPWTYNSIAVCLDAMGRRRMAGEYLRKALEIAPDLVVARTNLAVHYWKERDLDSARREIAAAYGFNPLDVRVRRTAQLIEREPPP